MTTNKKLQARKRRQVRARRRISGTAERPRLSVFRSSRHIYAQLIDDEAGTTLAAASTVADEIQAEEDGGKIAVASQVGTLIAERATAAGITTVVFDRGGNRYAGRVAALADAARKGGLTF